MEAIVVLGVTFILMWVLFILPQQRRVKAHQALVRRLEVGDEVMTAAGLYGTITALDDEVASLEIAPGVVVRSARGAIARRVGDEVVETPARPSSTAADRAVDET